MSCNIISRVCGAAIIATAFAQTFACTVDSAGEWAAS
jgi:hypothetical protein